MILRDLGRAMKMTFREFFVHGQMDSTANCNRKLDQSDHRVCHRVRGWASKSTWCKGYVYDVGSADHVICLIGHRHSIYLHQRSTCLVKLAVKLFLQPVSRSPRPLRPRNMTSASNPSYHHVETIIPSVWLNFSVRENKTVVVTALRNIFFFGKFICEI